MMKNYIYQNLLALDRLCNTILGGRADETMSSRLYRNSQKGYWYAKAGVKVLDRVFGWFGDKEHCKTSYENGLAGGHRGMAYK